MDSFSPLSVINFGKKVLDKSSAISYYSNMARNRRLVAKTEYEVIQQKFFGTEEPKLDAHLADALNWYSQVCEDDHAKLWLNDYLAKDDRQEEIDKLVNVPKDWIPRTAGWLARLSLRGYPLTDHNLKTIETKLASALCHQDAKAEEAPKVKPNVQEYMREKASDLIGEVEGMIDDKTIDPTFSFYNFLLKEQVSGIVAAKMLTHFAPIADELIEAMEPQDDDLKEAYPNREDLEDMAIVYQGIVDDLNRYVGNAKKTRKPRTKKKPTKEKLLKHFVYAKSNDKMQLVSVDPAKIIGSNELWTFNPNKMLLSVYRANDSDGLNVRRSVIININETTSMSKKIGRKTEERIKTVLDGGKVALRKLMDDISGKGKEVSRITKDTILLRVI